MKKKLGPHLENETRVGYPLVFVAGADEVGRGCLAGPVVAGAVVLPERVDYDRDSWLKEVKDSKIVRASVREELSPLIQNWAAAWAIGIVSVAEIDQINIFHASHLAIIRALKGLRVKPAHVLVDGKFLPKTGMEFPASAIIKGDQSCLSIAAASILAKVWRDQHMLELDQKYPGYGLAQHKGYPTEIHSDALKKLGVTDIHRKSFSTVAALA